MEQKEAVLLVANYSNKTGYAWNNIFRLFNSIATSLDKKNLNICMSFAEIAGHVDIINTSIPFNTFIFDPYNLNLRSLLILRKNIKQHNIKFVYFTDMKTWHWLYALLRLWGIRRIIVHCRISVKCPYPTSTKKGVTSYIKSSLNQLPIIRADYIYAISEFVRSRIINKHCYPSDRTLKILNGINVDKYACTNIMQHDNEIIIFCCSRATKHKGIATLIASVALLVSEYDINNFTLNYAGSGPDLEEFKTLATKLNISEKVFFLGQLESTHTHACNADIIVIPSEWGEGFGSTVAEAMAAGKAVIATQAGGIPEVIGDTDFGLLIPPGDSTALAESLSTLIRDKNLREKLGKKAQQRAREKFDEVAYHNRVTDTLSKNFGI